MDSTPHWIAPGIGFAALSMPPRHHFFGYYEKCPWDESGRRLLAMESAFADRMPAANDRLAVGFIDTAQGKRFEPFDYTFAWCWQQGTMLQWLPGAPNHVIYNQRAGNRFISVIRNLESGQTRTLPLPVYAVSPNGDYALSLNFARLNHQRPGYGYEGVPDHTINDFCPANDGVYRLDLQTGAWKLVLSLAQAADLNRVDSMTGAMQKFNHIQIAPDGSRFAVIHRWRPPTEGRELRCDRLITANPDGGAPYLLADYGMFSHYDWVNPKQIIAWAEAPQIGRRYFLFDDKTQDRQIVGDGILDCDGHMTLSPNRQWMLTDTYPDKNHMRTLLLWKWPDGPRVDIAKFYSPPELEGPLRCDLHPRWNRDGQQICIDSAHAGTRQMYALDVSAVVNS
jgi:hypothetical protein